MIKYMRDIAPVVLWVVLIAFVSTIFLGWGMDFTNRNKREQYIGKVGAEKIPLEQFARKVEMERERMRINSAYEASPQQLSMVPRQVWETEVKQILLKEMFDKMELYGTAEEVFEYIRRNPPPQVLEIPAFQTDSVFDTSKFVQFLNTPASFDNPGMLELELYTRNMIVPMEKLRKLLEIGRVPTKVEIEKEYRDMNDKAVFEYVKVSPSSFQVDSSAITDPMISSYYTAHPDSFTEEEQAELYFVRIAKEATAEDEQTYYNELMDIKNRVESGEATFEEEARIESDDDGSAENGGELGWFKRGQMVKEFETAAFNLKPGTISKPVKTDFGYHLIYVEQKETKDGVEEVKAKHILRKIVPTAETLDSLQDLVETLRTTAIQQGLSEAVKAHDDLSVDSTGLFKRGEMVPGIGYLSNVHSYAFSEEEEMDTISEPFENDNAFFLLQRKRLVPEGVTPLADVRNRIKKILADSLQKDKALEYCNTVKSRINNATSLKTLQETDSLVTSGITDTVTRKQYVPNVGYNNSAVAVAFALPENTLSNIVEDKDAFFIVKPVWKNLVNSIPTQGPEIQRIEESLAQQARRNAYMEWYVSYKQKFDIEEKIDHYYYDY